ncbi:MAG: phage major capsid protein, partial [Bacteroidales bacterium]|nr:phage major capsid protein [Bacteroidales bacterium]
MNELKYLKIHEGSKIEPDQMEFLQTLDGGFDKLQGGLQKQINDIYTRIDPVNRRPNSSEAPNTQERELTKKWLVKFLKKQPLDSVNAEFKDFSPLHTTADLDNSGAVLVPELLMREINHYVIDGGIARREMRYMPMNGAGNTRRIPVETGGVTVQWVDEGAPKPITGLTIE